MKKYILILSIALSLIGCNNSGSDSNSNTLNQTSKLNDGGSVSYLTTPQTISPSQPLKTTIQVNGISGTVYTINYIVNNVESIDAQPQIITNPTPCIITGSGSCNITVSMGNAGNSTYSITPNVYINNNLVSNNLPLAITTSNSNAPSAQWLASNLQQFLANSGLTGYKIANNTFYLNETSYYIGSNDTSSIVIALDLNTQQWKNVTFNLNLSSAARITQLNNKLYVFDQNNLYIFNNDNWQLIGNIPSEYTLANIVASTNNNFILILANNNTQSIIYQIENNQLKELTTLNGSFYGLIIDNANNSWIIYNQTNYIVSSNTQKVLSFPTLAPQTYGYIEDYAGGVFVYSSYLCNSDTCTQISGIIPTATNPTSQPYNFVNQALNNGNWYVLSNSIGYRSQDNYYTCDLNSTTAIASNCHKVAESPVNEDPNTRFGYIKINNDALPMGINMAFNYYIIVNNQWTNIAPQANDSMGSGSVYSYCTFTPTTSILMAVNSQSNTYYSMPNSNTWAKLDRPTNTTAATPIGSYNMTGNTYNIELYGLSSFNYSNSTGITEVYTYKYHQNCSKTFN